MLKTALSMTILPAVILLAGGCCHTEDDSSINSKVGSNHVAVLSVTRWDDYKDQLQPQFNLSAGDALNSAVVDTLQIDQAVQHAFQAALALKLAPSAKLPAGFGTGQSGEGLSATPPATASPAVNAPPTAIDKATLKTDPYLQYLAGTALFQEVKMLNRYVTDAAIRDKYRAYVVRLQISTMPTKRGLPFDAYTDVSLFFSPFGQGVTATGGGMKSAPPFAVNSLNIEKLDWSPDALPEGVGSLFTKEEFTANAKLVDELARAGKVEIAQKILSFMRAKITEADTRASTTNSANTAQSLNPDAQSNGSSTLLNSNLERTKRLKDINIALDYANNQLSKSIGGIPNPETPIIVPLLVTDEVEAQLAARRADDLQQLSFSLAAAYAGIGGEASVQNVQSAMQAALGHDYNSLFSLARVNDNTVRVRLGARQTGTNASKVDNITKFKAVYELTNQTHNVSLLVMVPKEMSAKDAATVYFGTRSMFINTVDGKSVAPKKETDDAVILRLNSRLAESTDFRTVLDYGLSTPVKEADEKVRLKAIARAAQNSQYKDFLKALDLADTAVSPEILADANRLWLVLASERMESLYDGGQFDVPPYIQKTLGDNQIVLLTDDGKKTTTSIPIPAYFDPKDLQSSLTINFKEPVAGTLNFGAGTYTLGTGTTTTGTITLGNGTVTLAGGTVGTLMLGPGTFNSAAAGTAPSTFTLGAGTITFGTVTFSSASGASGTGTYALGDGKTGAGTLTTGGGTFTFGTGASGAGTFTSGPGTLSLGAGAANTGTFTLGPSTLTLKAGVNDASVTLAASQIRVQDGQLNVTFPSLKGVKANGTAVSEHIDQFKITSADGGVLLQSRKVSYQLTATDAKKPIATLSINRELLEPDHDSPDLVITFDKSFTPADSSKPENDPSKKDNEKLYPIITVDKATLAVLPAGWIQSQSKPGSYVVTKDGKATMQLTGLVPGVEIKFTITSPADTFDKADLTIKVASFPPLFHP